MGIATSVIPKDMIGPLRSEEDLENLLHSQKNYENIIELDKENQLVDNASEEDVNRDNVMNKTQENEMIITEQTKGKQITDDTNVTIQNYTDSETESAIQAAQDPILKKIESVQTIRTNAKFNLKNQAEKMVAMSADKYPNMEVGQNVRLKVPDIDRAKTDPKSIIAIVMDVKENEFYQLGTKMGVLKQLYTKNQFTSCSEDFIKIEEVVKDKEFFGEQFFLEQFVTYHKRLGSLMKTLRFLYTQFK
ncbi:hypothetical protein PYW08_002768 [Mythimna loreyi]|uniref:Uncharacterized protein n=1 Tax=Mythimna loreyi TaxID=667449 RepID=A0ACC2QMW0_9NEOP|nr:hypothetical protein PYW08_002768 [Mythimna loreyi]